jgi:hypothetical protein
MICIFFQCSLYKFSEAFLFPFAPIQPIPGLSLKSYKKTAIQRRILGGKIE